jgi:acyl-CoA synthetase (AMP-forming)/AMP-acid ligase II
MKGYWEDPENTSEALRDGWLYSGDVATCDKDGFYTFRERIREIIIHGGSNVGPHEVEDVIDSHPNVKESCVVGVPDPHYGAILVAYVEWEPDSSPVELSDLQAWLEKHLAAYKVPDYWFEVKQLPKTAPGKIDRKSLHIRAKTAI